MGGRKLLISPSTSWHAQEALPDESKTQQRLNNPNKTVEGWQSQAQKLMEEQSNLFESSATKNSKSENKWVATVSQQGTVSDKIAALTLMFQEGPVFRIDKLQNLLTMAQKNNKREAILATNAIKTILLADTLPDRKLKYFKDHDWTIKPSDAELIIRLFEDKLKRFYMDFIKSLETLLHDAIVNTRRHALMHVFDLLVAKPEQEKNLLSLLVDKLGDLDRSLAAKASYLLSQLLVKHVNMKGVVIKQVEELLFRPNVGMRAQYYALIFLNQIILTHRDGSIANQLIETYFNVYTQLVRKGDIETKILSALLTGINRAFPFADMTDEVFDKHMDTLFRIIHVATFNTAVQALLLIFQVSTARQTDAERYYRTLYDIMLDRRLFSSSKQPLFLNLLYKSIKNDTNNSRIRAFIKRVLQIASFQQPTFICAVLIMISELVKVQENLWIGLNTPENNTDDDEVEHFVDAPEEDDSKPPSQTSKPLAASKPSHSLRYDAKKREPQFSNAQYSCFWELNELMHHFHPSVSKFAQTLLSGSHIQYAGDPLADFTLANFLERFVYKNPKKTVSTARGSSIMQPSRPVRPHPDKVAVFSNDFIARKKENTPADQLFFYKYFVEKQIEDAASAKKKRKPAASDMEMDVDAGLTDAEIDSALGFADDGEDDEAEQVLDGEDQIAEDDEADLSDEDSGYEGLENALESVDDEDSTMETAPKPKKRKLAVAKQEDKEEEDEEEEEEEDEGKEEEKDDEDDDEEEEEDLDAMLFDDNNGEDDDTFDGFDEVDDLSDEEEEEAKPTSKRAAKKQARLGGMKELLKGINLDGSTFASADDFAHLLDENGSEVHTKSKQSKWEERTESYGKKRKAEKSSTRPTKQSRKHR